MNFYREHSRSGSAYETTQPCWALEMTYGQYNFVSLSTADNNGPPWPGDNATITQEELNEFETNLTRLGEAKFWMAFGHHPLQGVGRHEDVVQLLKQYNIHDYACGHAHDFVIRRDFDYLMQYRINSMGQSEVNNIGIYVIDNNTLSFTATSIKETWPALVVTAPVAAKLKSTDGEDVANPHAVAVPNQCENAPLRVLAFDNSTIDSIRFKIDSGSWQNMTARIYQDNQWRATFDATALVVGIHEIKIEVDGSKVRSFDSNFMVVNAVCNIGEEDEDNPFEVGEIIVDGLIDGDIDGDDTDNNIDGDDDAYIDGDMELVENQESDFEQTEKESSESNMICDPGSLRCKDDITVEICNIIGFWQDRETCEDGYCLNGECNYDKPNAPDGDIQADGDQINPISEGSAGDSGCSNTANDSSWLVLLCLLGVWYRQRRYEINL